MAIDVKIILGFDGNLFFFQIELDFFQNFQDINLVFEKKDFYLIIFQIYFY